MPFRKERKVTIKEAGPQTLPLPQSISRDEMDERALQFAATALVERLIATENDIDELGVKALVFSMQNLMRLFDVSEHECDIRDGSVLFTRSVSKGDWETGRWELSWNVRSDGS